MAGGMIPYAYYVMKRPVSDSGEPATDVGVVVWHPTMTSPRMLMEREAQEKAHPIEYSALGLVVAEDIDDCLTQLFHRHLASVHDARMAALSDPH